MRARRFAFTLLLATLVLALTTTRARAQSANPSPQGVSVEEHLGAPVPQDLTFRDHEGKRFRLGDAFDGKRPVLLVMMYHRCPMLCSVVLDSVARSLRDVKWTVGDQFDVLTVSIDPRDGVDVAAQKRRQILEKYGRPDAQKGWRFVVGEDPAIHALADAVGFRYRWDADQGQYVHPAVIFLLTPDGRIARYLYGVDYPSQEVELGLLEASEGRSITTTERVLLYCYQYDPKAHRYVLATFRLMRAGAAVILVVVGGALAILWSRDRRRRSTPEV